MSITILRATQHLNLDGISYEGCPLLLRDGILDPVPTHWFMFLWRESSLDTTATYAASLKSWLTWLTFLGVDLWSVSVDDLSRYKRTLVGRRANATINVQTAAVCSFYKWAFHSGLSPILPFRLASRRSNNDGVPQVRPAKVFTRVPETHTKAEFDAILGATNRTGAGNRLRDELIAELGRYSGLRRMEVAGLTVQIIAKAHRQGRHFVAAISTTKNGKPRKIIVPSAQMNRIKRYIAIYRAFIVAKRRAANKDYVEPDSLFLTVGGNPVRREYITATWAASAKAANIQSRFHVNRHTFGTAVVVASKMAGLHPRRLAQDLLGHASEETTAIYDHSKVVLEDERWFADNVSDMIDE